MPTGFKGPEVVQKNILLVQQCSMYGELKVKSQLMTFSYVHDIIRTVNVCQESTLVAKSARIHTATAFPRQVKVAREFASRLTCRAGAKASTSVVPAFIYNKG